MSRKIGDFKRSIFPCLEEDCDATFKQNALFVYHMKKQHGVEL